MNPPPPVATTLVCFFHCTRGCGCGEHPVFPAPSDLRDEKFLHDSGVIGAAGSRTHDTLSVMAGLDPAIHVFLTYGVKDVDARDKRGHDEWVAAIAAAV
jgi:hypothetical protein